MGSATLATFPVRLMLQDAIDFDKGTKNQPWLVARAEQNLFVTFAFGTLPTPIRAICTSTPRMVKTSPARAHSSLGATVIEIATDA